MAEWTSRLTLMGTIAVAPWLIGSVPARFQLWLACGVLLSFLFWIASFLFRKANEHRRIVIPVPVLFLGLLSLVGIAQLAIPLPVSPIDTVWAVELGRPVNDEQGWRPTSISPELTRFQLARLIVIVLAAFLGAQLFRSSDHFLWLFGTMAAVGAALAVFGIAQKLSWNGQLLGSIPLRYGGEPFATFVNRNNAAGDLNICLAAALGGILLSAEKRWQRQHHSMAIIFLMMAILTITGIVASGSRGGMASAGIGLLIVTPWFITMFGTRALIGLLSGGVGVLLLGIWLNFGTIAVQRLETLNDLPNALQGRWQHWRDSAGALWDRPWLGSGWGTYRYANLPYQQRDVTTWYWNADNQFFEAAIEGGSVTVFGMMAVLMAFALSLVSLRGSKSPLRQALVVCGLFLLVSLSVQSTTDFGISLMALALAGSVLMGAISTMASLREMKLSKLTFPQRWLTLRTVTLTAATLLTAGTVWASREIVQAQSGFTFCEQVPVKLDAPDLLSANELAELIDQGRELSAKLPDHAEVHYSLARLLIYRYQLEIFDAAAVGLSARGRKNAWQNTRLENLSHVVHLSSEPEWLQHVTGSSAVKNNLPEAITELRAANNACSAIPGVGYRLALLSPVDPQQTDQQRSAIKLLRREALLSSGNSVRLLNVGMAALENDDDELAVLCWRRAVAQQPALLKEAVEAARLGLEDDQLALELCSTPDQLIAYSEMTNDFSAKAVIVRRLGDFRAQLQRTRNSASEGQVEWISARMSLLADRKDEGIAHLQRAVACEPFQLTWRVTLADLLIEQGDDAQAREHLAWISRMTPDDREIRKRLQAVVTRELHKRASSPDASTMRIERHASRVSSTMQPTRPVPLVAGSAEMPAGGRP